MILILGVDGRIHEGEWSDQFRYGESGCGGDYGVAALRKLGDEVAKLATWRVCTSCFVVDVENA